VLERTAPAADMDKANAAAFAVGIVVAYAVAGLALQHGAYVLQYGSLFDPLRRWLERKACAPGSPRLTSWACARVRELFACQLCAITQLALWFCAVPVTTLAAWWGGLRPLGLAPALAVAAYALLGLAVTFSAAAVGLICWDLARFVDRGSDAVILYLRARKDAAEAQARWTRPSPRFFGSLPRHGASHSEGRILRTAGSGERRA
jgi:hypothetical protein